VPEHWIETKTKFTTSFTTGWTPPTGNHEDYLGENLWANISDLGPKYLEDTTKRISDDAVKASRISVSPAGSLLFSFKLSIGQVSIARKSMYTNEAIATFRASEVLDLQYAYFAFPLFLVQNAAENIYGAKLLNQELIRAAAFPLPSLQEQLAIATFLDHETTKIDALIAEQNRLIELLQEKRQAVISHAVTKGLNPHAPMKDSGVEWLGEVPEHWEIMGLTKAIGPVVDYRGRTPTKCDSGTLLVTAKNIRSGEIDYALSEEYVDPLEAEELLQRGRPVIGDVLFTMEAPLGQVALVDREDIALAQRVVKFRGITGRMTNRYLMWWLVGSHCQHQLNLFSTGSTALGLKASKLSAITCVVPPVDEQLAIVDHVNISIGRLSEIHKVAISQIALLQERRSALISAAVTGQIDVRGLVPEAVAA
jgi:type I restriction enzyme S subunit